MNLAKLGKRVRSELARNPKKSALLGVICLVALYFWAPLLRGWVAGGKTKKPDTKPIAASPVSPDARQEDAALSSITSERHAKPVVRWDKVLSQRGTDPLTASLALDAIQRNPFEASSALVKALENGQSEPASPGELGKPASALAERTPEAAGLVLKGTVVGKQMRLAQINQRTYREGETIEEENAADLSRTARASAAPDLYFTLSSIHKDHVVLTRGDKSYTLAFPRQDKSRGESLVQFRAPQEAP